MPWKSRKDSKSSTSRPDAAEARPVERALLPSGVGSRGVPIVTTQFSMWYWRDDEGKIHRWQRDDSSGAMIKEESAMLFPDANTLKGATKIAAHREYRRLLKEVLLEEREGRDAQASTS